MSEHNQPPTLIVHSTDSAAFGDLGEGPVYLRYHKVGDS